jgi:hypothetical protein
MAYFPESFGGIDRLVETLAKERGQFGVLTKPLILSPWKAVSGP